MALGEWLATADALLMAASGERVAVSHATREFWDDPDDDVIEVAHEAVRAALTARRGERPRPVCGRPSRSRSVSSPRFAAACSCGAAGQHDAESPIRLVVGFGDTPIG
jgi:hypothetical protein